MDHKNARGRTALGAYPDATVFVRVAVLAVVILVDPSCASVSPGVKQHMKRMKNPRRTGFWFSARLSTSTSNVVTRVYRDINNKVRKHC